MEVHPFVCPASRCTYGFTGHVTKAYVSDSNQITVVYWSVYSDFSPTLYVVLPCAMCIILVMPLLKALSTGHRIVFSVSCCTVMGGSVSSLVIGQVFRK